MGAHRFSLGRVARLALVSTFAVVLPAAGQDSPWLSGIHWYGEHRTGFPDDGLVEEMTGGKGIWVLETILTEDGGIWGLEAQLPKLRAIRARGHSLIVRIQPRWGLVVPGPDDPGVAPGDRMATFLAKVVDAAQKLSQIAHVWQIGNEMNLGFEYDVGNLTPELYVDKYVRIREAIRSISSSLGPQVVLVGPVAPVDNAYLERMCDALLAGGHDPDGFALHAYGGARGRFLDDVMAQAAALDGKGFSRKPIHITEWGAPVEPVSDTNEAATARFLLDSFQALARYNADPASHPVVSAVWFVYARDQQWRSWSLLGLRDLHPRGVSTDLYDAFRFAATLDLPAGDDFSDDAGGELRILASPALLEPTTLLGQSPPADTLGVAKKGPGTLRYQLETDVPWIALDPTEGVTDGGTDSVRVSYLISSLAPGTHSGSIRVLAPDAVNHPQTVSVRLTLRPNAPAPDLANPDFEADGRAFTVAGGWLPFGGNKWEGITSTGRGWSQGIADVPPGGDAGVLQTFPVLPGVRYRARAWSRSQSPRYETAIGVASRGETDPRAATFGSAASIDSFTLLTHEFTAEDPTATLFLRARNTSSFWATGRWALFDDVSIEVLGGGGPAVPRLQVSPSSLTFSVVSGSSPLPATLGVRNAGSGTMSFTVSDDADWLSVVPASGTSAGESRDLRVEIRSESLPTGRHQATLTIEASGADGSPTAVRLTLDVTPSSPSVPVLENGSFEGGIAPGPDPDRRAPVSWRPFVLAGNPKRGVTWLGPGARSPSFVADFWEGNWTAGLSQRVTGTTPGARYEASAWLKATNGDVRFFLGIDPDGGSDPGSGAVVWRGPFLPGNVWDRFAVETTARGSAVSVFIRAENPRPWSLNAFIDDAALAAR